MRDLLAIHSLSTRGLSLGLIASAAMTIPAVSVAAPLILAEPTAKVPIPDARFDSVGDVAIDGDFMIMGVDHDYFPGPYEWWRTSAGYLFRRQDSRTWTPVRKLAETNLSVWDDDVPPMQVAMRNGIAAMTWYGQQLLAFERSGADWVSAPVNLNQLGIQGTELEIDGGTILASADTCGNGGFAFRKDATGSYVPVQRYDGAYRGCDAEQLGGDVDISGSIVVIPQQYGEDGSTPPVLYIWEGIPTSAPPTLLGQGGAASIQGDTLAEGGIYNNVSGTQIYRRQSAGVWSHEQTIAMPDGLQTTFLPADLQMEDGFLMQGRNGNVEMFQRDSTGQFKYVAKLLDAGKAHITQRRVVTHGSDGAVKVYELPASLSQPELKQDDFQDADANGWEPQAGSSYAVVSTPYSYAYRQSSLVGNAMSLLTNIDWKNQSIQADVKPTAFDGNDRWFGLIGRYIDPNNYYYVTVRNSNSVQLRKMVNGVFQSLGSAPLSVAVNRNYNVRFEAIGSLLRVYVDDVLALEANDSTHSHGRVGLMTYKTRADFDNVIVDSQQSTTLLADDFGVCNRRIWTVQGEGNW
ncbi:MAG: hypothetical protein ACJ8OJ_08350, partial [Povalibacter sp.]